MTDCWGVEMELIRAIGWNAGMFLLGMSAAFGLTRLRYQKMLADMEAQRARACRTGDRECSQQHD